VVEWLSYYLSSNLVLNPEKASLPFKKPKAISRLFQTEYSDMPASLDPLLKGRFIFRYLGNRLCKYPPSVYLILGRKLPKQQNKPTNITPLSSNTIAALMHHPTQQ